MGRREDLSDFDKGQIVMARRQGRSISETAQLVGCSRTAVVNVYRRWTEEGHITNRRLGVGRPRLIDAQAQERLASMIGKNKRPTLAQVTEIFNDATGKKVSQHTMHRTMMRMGLRARKQVGAPVPSTPAHRHRRLLWAREHQNWTVDQWKKVAWSEESRFTLLQEDGEVRVRRLPLELKAPGGSAGNGAAGEESSVTLWAAFCWDTLGPVIAVDASLTSDSYLDIVAEQVPPFMGMVFPDGSGFFQQDNAPCHTADCVQEWFEEHSEEFSLLPWPTDSPDLNPMKNLWDVLEQEVQSADCVQEWFEEHSEEFSLLPWPTDSPDLNPMKTMWDVLEQQVQSAAAPPGNLQELKDLLMKSWCQIPQNTFRGLVESMPQRVEAVLAANGGPTAF
uniref:Transposase Tc1-like domain-containing protein n=1 Tax=Astyanax mexicanus TaxID=7994 RepID=A0A3B1JRE4_ASTMX